VPNEGLDRRPTLAILRLYGLELKPRDALLGWLDELSAAAEPPSS